MDLKRLKNLPIGKIILLFISLLIFWQLRKLITAFFLAGFITGPASEYWKLNPHLAKALNYGLMVAILLGLIFFRRKIYRHPVIVLLAFFGLSNLLLFFLWLGSPAHRIESDKAKYLANPTGTKQLCVVMDGNLDLADRLDKYGIESDSSVFTARFKDEKLESVLDNDTLILREMETEEYCRYLLVGNLEASSTTRSDLEGLIITNLVGKFKLLKLAGFTATDFTLTSRGVGFSNQVSEGDAQEKLTDALSLKLAGMVK